MAKRETQPRAPVLVRMPEPLRERLDEAVTASGQSMNAEIIQRLERSFEAEDRFGGPILTELVEAIAHAMKSTGQHAGFLESRKAMRKGRWMSLPYAFDQAIKAALTILEHHRPPGEIVVPKPNIAEVVGGDSEQSKAMAERLMAELGQLFALKELRDQEEEK